MLRSLKRKRKGKLINKIVEGTFIITKQIQIGFIKDNRQMGKKNTIFFYLHYYRSCRKGGRKHLSTRKANNNGMFRKI